MLTKTTIKVKVPQTPQQLFTNHYFEKTQKALEWLAQHLLLIKTMFVCSTLFNKAKWIGLVVLGVGFSLVGFGQDEILLYENDFETYKIEPSNTWCYLDNDKTFVNDLWGGTSGGIGGDVLFAQTYTVETMLINGEDDRYIDPDGIGGNYCIGMLSMEEDDMLSLTLDSKGLTFLNISFTLSAIDLDGCGYFGVDTPIMKIGIFDTPEGVFNFTNTGYLIGETTLTGIEPNLDKYTFNWVEVNSNVNIDESTNGNISIVFDLTQSGYAAFDNLRITTTENIIETCDTTEINLENGLVAHYPFDGDATDVSTNTNNGEIFGATLTTDRFGNENNAFHFDGSSHIRVIDHPTLRPQNFTISLWSRFDDLDGELQLLIDKHLGTDYLDSYEIWLEDQTIQATIGDENDFGLFLKKKLMPDSLKWYHIVYSFSDENDVANLYIDTMLVDSKNEPTTIAYDSEPLLIGASNDLQSPNSFFKGDIDDVRIYDRVLSSCEIEALFELPYVSYIESDCGDGMDNDGDTYIDCEDLDCITDDLCDDINQVTACPVDSAFMLRPGDGVFTCASGGSSDRTVVAIKNIDEVLPKGLDTNEDISNQIFPGRKFSKDEIGGEVFGTCIDNAGNIYVAATTLYSYDRNNFENNFASIVKINGDSLQIDSSFSRVLKQSSDENGFKNNEGYAVYVENNNGWNPPNLRNSRITYSGLGNICFDSNRNHLLVTNFEDGKIWRINTNGIVIDNFDPFELDNGEPGFSPLGERLWGIQAFPLPNGSTEVYFGVWSTDRRIENTNSPLNITNGKNLLMSVTINSSGSFDVLSLDTITVVPDINVSVGNKTNVNQPISDITISKDGLRLVFACKTMSADISLIGEFNHAFAHHSSLFYVERNDNQTDWEEPIRFNISRNTTIGNSAGGVDFGPRQAVANYDFGSICDQMVWASGDNLLDGVTTYGLQGFSIFEVFNENPVNIDESYVIDADGISGNAKSYLGDFEIFKCDCFECNVSLRVIKDDSHNEESSCCFVADLRNLGVSTNAAKIELIINESGVQFDTLVTIESNFSYSVENEKLVLSADTSASNYPLLPNLNSNNFLNFCILNNEAALDEYTFTVKYFNLDNEELNLCQQSLLVKTDGCVISPSPKGCTDIMACNYNPSATIDDGSCIPCYKDCEGNILSEKIPGYECESENSTALLSYNDINCNCIDENIVVQCIVETPTNPVFAGEEYCFKITVTDSLTNDTLVNFPVSYFIEGANQNEIMVETTDSLGQIQFCYTALNPGLDFINITSGNFNLIFNALIFDFNFSPINLNFGPFSYTSSSGSLENVNSLPIGEEICTTVVIEDDIGEIITGVEVTVISIGENTGDTLVNLTRTTNTNGEINFCGTNPEIGIEQCILSIPSTDEMMTTDTTIYLIWIDPNEPMASCNDNIQNGNEIGIDCGGDCPACSTEPIPGCTDSNFCEYNPEATEDDGSCQTSNADPGTCNNNCSFDILEEWNPQTCACQFVRMNVSGCMDEMAVNYNPNANCEPADECYYPNAEAVFPCNLLGNWQVIDACSILTEYTQSVPYDVEVNSIHDNNSILNFSNLFGVGYDIIFEAIIENDQVIIPTTELWFNTISAVGILSESENTINWEFTIDIDNAISTCDLTWVRESVPLIFEGCTDFNANNYDSRANCDDGNCTYDNQTPTCTDNLQNGNETGVDCGGDCEACSTDPTPTPNCINNPVVINHNVDCSARNGTYNVQFSVSGGGAGAQGGTYQITGDYTGTIVQGEVYSIGALAEGTSYSLTVIEDGFGCSASINKGPNNCSKVPIELLHFEGEVLQEGNLLKWATATEIENEHFSLYHSIDGYEYELINRQKGAGTVSTTQQYQFLDRNASSGIHYYQLQQTDFDGTTTTVGHISLQRGEMGLSILNIIPMPVDDQFDLLLTNHQSELVQIEIHNHIGQLVYGQPYHLKPQLNNLQLNVQDLSGGVYLLSVKAADKVVSKKILKY